jgi:hypothetical protein
MYQRESAAETRVNVKACALSDAPAVSLVDFELAAVAYEKDSLLVTPYSQKVRNQRKALDFIAAKEK